MAVTLRPVEPADYAPIVAELDAWWGGRPMAAMLPKLFFVHFRDTSFIAEVDGARAGFLIGFLSSTRPDEAYVHFVGVDPNHRKGNVGRLLYERFCAAARERGRRVVRLVTSPANATSIAFHRRLGFRMEPSPTVIDGVPVHRDYDGPGEDRVLFFREI